MPRGLVQCPILTTSPPPTHVIFDLDGVLLDTEHLYTEVTQAVVARFGKTFDWALKAKTIGRGAREAATLLVDELGLPISPEKFLAERDRDLAVLFPGVAEIPGARAFTAALRDRAVPMAVATSTDEHHYRIKVGRHRDWFSFFSVVVCGDDPRLSRPKPHPDIFLLAAGDLGADPARCLVFEDSPAGVTAARAAGMRVVAMPDPHVDRSAFADADWVVRNFEECAFPKLGL
jgi:pseudouridine 5'-phosphatase